jgi:steroid 5-alpha reductase family enzyme
MTSLWTGIQPFARIAPWIILVSAAVAFPVLFFVPAPYGRHFRPGWGPAVSARLGWVAMEWPSVVLFALVWFANPEVGTPMVTALGLLWLVHYLQRTFVFSLLQRSSGRRQALLTVVLADLFNVLNATGNAAALRDRPFDAAFVVGSALFAGGLLLNVHSDHLLRRLRAPGETAYKVPVGGGFAWVSAPNYLGEIVEWVGFAIAARTLAGWAFAIFTFANLAPRAVANHRWYRERFADYPANRRALIPFVW